MQLHWIRCDTFNASFVLWIGRPSYGGKVNPIVGTTSMEKVFGKSGRRPFVRQLVAFLNLKQIYFVL